MNTISTLLILLGCFLLYSTSKKVVLTSKLELEQWMQKNNNTSKIIGITFLACALYFLIFNYGLTSGFLYWLLILTIVLCLLLLCYPLKIINYKQLTVLFVFLLIFEITFL